MLVRRDIPIVELLRDGFAGVCFVLIGVVLLWMGFSKQFNAKLVAGGGVMVALGVFFSWRAFRRLETMKAIARR